MQRGKNHQPYISALMQAPDLNNDVELVAAEKQQFIDEQRQKNAVVAEGFCSAEGQIGQGKRRFGLGLIREKLAVTQGSTIALTVLVMNLGKLLELLFVLFASCLRLLLGNKPGKGSRFAHLSTQVALV